MKFVTYLFVPTLCAATLLSGPGVPARAQCSNAHALDPTSSAGSPESWDEMGDALAVGDFDNDGRDDLVIGTPWKEIGGIRSAGEVTIHYGRVGGPSEAAWSRWTQNSITGTANEAVDLFGSVFGVGDFDADGYDDLVIGIPREDHGDLEDAGRFAVKYGDAGGLNFFNPSDSWSQAYLAGNGNQAGDYFGAALATGDFDGDGYDDVAIGAPFDDIGAIENSGRVVVVYGGRRGLRSENSEAFNQVAVDDANEENDAFGYTLVAGDFNGDGYDDLAIGVPREVSDASDRGVVQLKYGHPSGLKAGDRAAFVASDLEVGPWSAYHFGEYLAAGDIDGDGYEDLVVGSGWANDMVGVVFGAAAGLVPVESRKLFPEDVGVIGSEISLGHGVLVADLDGDGYGDIVAGAPRYKSHEGRVAVFFGNSSRDLTANSRWFGESCMSGENARDQFFGKVLAAGDFDGDGILELAAGDPNHDSGGVARSGAVFVATVD